jgi:hypothetical protein
MANYTNARYDIVICDSYGNRITSIATADTNQFVSFSAVRSLGRRGALTIEFSGGDQQSSFFPLLERFGALRKDSIIEVWRITGKVRSLLLDTVWWIRLVTRKISEQGIQSVSITAYDSIYLLESRININPNVAIQPAQYTLIGAPSFNMMYLVQQAFMPAALYGDRSVPNLATPVFSYNELYSIKIDVAKANLLETLNLLSDTSIQHNAPMYFDIVCSSASSMMFSIFPDQRGLDRRIGIGNAPGVIIGSNTGIVREMTTIADWTDEVTAVFPWGQNGSTINGFLTSPTFPIGIVSTPYSRREAISDAGTGDNNQTVDTAYGLIQSSRGSWNVSCTLQDTADFIFGVDWGYGDRMFVNAFGAITDCRIQGIAIAVSDKKEVIQLALNVTENIV